MKTLLVRFQEGAFALAFKSKHFPGECVATRRGSPLLVGIKTKTRLATDHIPILYGKGEKMAQKKFNSKHFFYLFSLNFSLLRVDLKCLRAKKLLMVRLNVFC